MAQLVKLDGLKHADMKLSASRVTEFARTRHMLAIQVTEISQAISSFPVLISRVQDQGQFALSALTAFEPEQNLFVKNDQWEASFQSLKMQTYPLYLMKADDGGQAPILGVYDQAKALNRSEGEALIVKGKPSLWVQNIKNRLIDDMKRSLLTYEFLEALDNYNLLKPVDIVLHYASAGTNRIRGLFMISEDQLKQVPEDVFNMLRHKGYLPPIYAMLFSVFQFNNLIRLHNHTGRNPIERISLEVRKDQNV